MIAPKQQAETAAPRTSFQILIEMMSAYGPKAPEIDLMLAAIDTGLPGFLDATRKLRGEQEAAWQVEQRAREAERAKRVGATAMEEAAAAAFWEERRAWWATWLDTGGRDAIASWQPTSTVPETCDGCWWAIGTDGNVLGVGATPADAHRAANEWVFETLSDPESAAHAFDDLRDQRDPMTELVYQGTAIQFLYVAGSVPNVAATVGRKFDRYVL